jgi:hypothetical protein
MKKRPDKARSATSPPGPGGPRPRPCWPGLDAAVPGRSWRRHPKLPEYAKYIADPTCLGSGPSTAGHAQG